MLSASLMLGGCTGGNAPSGGAASPGGVAASGTPTSAPTDTATSAPASGLPSGVVQATNLPTAVVNKPELRRRVSITSCVAASGGWKAAGTAKNDTSSAATYKITIFFTTDHGTVIGYGAKKVSVPPGETADWTIKAKLTPAPTTRCVLRGVG